MTKFEGCYLTNAGRSMVYNKGLTNVTFTKAVTGSGIYISKEEIPDMVELKEPRQEFGLDNLCELGNCTVSVKFKVNNIDLEQGYQLSEIGVYAKADEEEEILYCVAYALEGYTEEVPENDGSITYFMAVDIETVVSNDVTVTIVYSPEHEWSKDYIDTIIADIFEETTIEEAFFFVFTNIDDAGRMAMSTVEVLKALTTEWDGKSSTGINALSSEEIRTALCTQWDGQSSDDVRALTSSEILEITK